MYNWRNMTPEERTRALELRRARQLPWHSPPHLDLRGIRQYLISGACYEHKPIIGKSLERITDCEDSLLRICRDFCWAVYGWCVLPNHYHLLIRTDKIEQLRHQLGQFHGRSSHQWNGEDNSRGRKVWHNCFERPIKSDRHFWATLNYVHHNPVHHGYVTSWHDWPWSSAVEFLKQVGRQRALEIWERYPILDYGKKWDTETTT
jgi:putative transposase